MKTMIAMAVLVLALGPSVSAADTAHQASGGTMTSAARPAWIDASVKKMEDELAARYGDASRSRLARGLRQVSSLWIESDGDAAEFESFVRANFAGDEATYTTLLTRMAHPGLHSVESEVERPLHDRGAKREYRIGF